MMRVLMRNGVVAVCLGVMCGLICAQQTSFERIKAPPADQVRAELFAWLKDHVRADEQTLQQAEKIWAQESRPVLVRLADIFALASADARKLLAQANDPQAVVPTEVPAVLRQAQPAFFRANLALAYARLLCLRKAYEEALEVLRAIQPEHTADPAAYYFFRCIAEHKTLHRTETLRSADRLLQERDQVPERYFVLAALLKYDLEGWNGQKNLDYVARRMEEIAGRLDNARGGPKTQEKQKEILDLLAKMVKDLEDQLQQGSGGGGGGGGGQAGGSRATGPGALKPSSPAGDSAILGGRGEGKVDMKELVKRPDLWGKLPEKERVKVLEAIRREYPPHVAEAIEAYLQQIARSSESR
jgi:hypothetical protein